MKTTAEQRAALRVLSGIGHRPTLLNGDELRDLLDDLDAALKETPTAEAVIWRKACNEARDERDAALALLRKHEWLHYAPDGMDVPCCMACGGAKPNHATGCELAALLAELKGESDVKN